MGRILKRCAHCNADRADFREFPKKGAYEKATRFWNRRGGEL